MPDPASAGFLSNDNIFQVHGLTFPGGVADIIQCKSKDGAFLFSYKGPPDRIGAETTVNKMFHGDRYILRCFFIFGELFNQFHQPGTITGNRPANCNTHLDFIF